MGSCWQLTCGGAVHLSQMLITLQMEAQSFVDYRNGNFCVLPFAFSILYKTLASDMHSCLCTQITFYDNSCKA